MANAKPSRPVAQEKKDSGVRNDVVITYVKDEDGKNLKVEHKRTRR